MSDPLDFLGQSSETVAPRLLGCLLVRQLNGRQLVGKIVETEAYDQTDAASHSYRGQTPRTAIMFGPPGFLYVYFTYGMHYCCNVVVGPAGYGSAVLIRAIEPLEGLDIMEENRHGRAGIDMTNGPAKLCQALQINKANNGTDLRDGDVRLIIKPPVGQADIVQTTRIGIRHAADVPWRFYLKNNEYVSKKV
jgi:DNA-3-methyladenine glycosylase